MLRQQQLQQAAQTQSLNVTTVRATVHLEQ
jgi:hypothetical protein